MAKGTEILSALDIREVCQDVTDWAWEKYQGDREKYTAIRDALNEVKSKCAEVACENIERKYSK